MTWLLVKVTAVNLVIISAAYFVADCWWYIRWRRG